MSTRHEREQEFHDVAFAESIRRRVWHFYDLTGASTDYMTRTLLAAQPQGKRVLEFGCGIKTNAIPLARAGAAVTGIDISSVAIETARRQAATAGVTARASFMPMNAESLEFDDDAFDIVCGSAVLHHLDLDRAYAEVARVLRPEGVAVFHEPLGHNPLINLYRRRTPELRTPDEHPLLMSDLQAATAHFDDVSTRFFHLQTLAAAPFRHRRGFSHVIGALDAADRVLFRLVPYARRHAWSAVIRFTGPRRRPTTDPT